MPNGLFNPEANTSFTSALPAPSAARKTRTSPALLSAIKRSPLGAVRMRRGFERPLRNSSTLKPSGTRGQASAGRLTSFGPLTTESVAKGFGKSAMVTRRRTPGRSVVQSPSAPWPVSTPLVGAFALLRRCELVFRKPQTHIVPSTMAMVNSLNTFTVIFSPDLLFGWAGSLRRREILIDVASPDANSSINLRFTSLTARVQKIKIATLIRLGYVRSVQSSKATLIAWRFRFPLGATAVQLIIVDAQIEFPLSNIQFDQIAIAHQRERTADKRFWRNVQAARAVRGATHPRVGDPHHVADAVL